MKPILIVGPKESRLRFTDILSRAGYSTIESDTSDRAYQIARSVQPGLVLLSIVMPDSNGLETAARLRRLPEFEAVGIILLGCVPPLGIYDEPLALLVNGYLNLDASASELLACVNMQMQKRAMPDTNHRNESGVPQASRT